MSLVAAAFYVDPISGMGWSTDLSAAALVALAVFPVFLFALGVMGLWRWDVNHARRDCLSSDNPAIELFTAAVAAGDFETAERAARRVLRRRRLHNGGRRG